MTGPQVGGVHQDIERLSAFRGHRRFGLGRGTHVAGRVGGRLPFAVDRFELLFRIAREDGGAVSQVEHRRLVQVDVIVQIVVDAFRVPDI